MAKKSELQVITCATCKHASFVTVSRGDPRVINCAVSDTRKVADSKRKCSSYK